MIIFISPQILVPLLLLHQFHFIDIIIMTSSLIGCKIQYGGIPTLSHDDHCRDCLIHEAQTVVSATTYRDRRESMKPLARNILDGNCLDGKYFISRSWYVKKSSLICYGLHASTNRGWGKCSISCIWEQ